MRDIAANSASEKRAKTLDQLEASEASPPTPSKLASTLGEQDGFTRIINLATLVLVAAAAIFAFLSLIAGPRTDALATRPTKAGDEYIALRQSLDATRESVARIEQRMGELAPQPLTSSQPPGSVRRTQTAARSDCVRVYRSGVGTQLVCGR